MYDKISFIVVFIIIILNIIHIMRYSVLHKPIPFITMSFISMLFILSSVIILQSNLLLLWLLIGILSWITASCSNIKGYISNPEFIIQTVVILPGGLTSCIVQIINHKPLNKFPFLIFTIFVIFFSTGIFFVIFNIIKAKNKKNSAQTEIWAVPWKYEKQSPEPGTIQKLKYQTKAYATDSRKIIKEAIIYLPYKYNKNIKYNILYLLHGTGENQSYWLLNNNKNKAMIDNLIYYKDIKPLIIITPCWYVEQDYYENPDRLTFIFKEELRNDLIPAVEKIFSTYTEDTCSTALTASRNHRAFAGLSRGSAITYRTALNCCLDYFSWFGAFSGCMTSQDYFKTYLYSPTVKDFSINYLYNTSGSFDFLLLEHIKNLRLLLKNEKRLTLGENCSMDIFPWKYHSMGSWHIALYNCLQKFFK